MIERTGTVVKKLAKEKNIVRSCVMVEEQEFLSKFKDLGIIELYKNKDGVLLVNVPIDKIDEFVKLSLELMKPGRWNEYVGPQTGFYFKMPTGESVHIRLDDNGFSKIVEKLHQFLPNWEIKNKEDLWKWLSSIDIYKDFLADGEIK